MKKILTVAVLAVALVGVRVPTAQARGCEAGAILTGVVAGAVLVDALRPAPVYYAPAPVYYAQPAPVVYAAPAPVVYSAPAPTVVYTAPRQVVYVQPAPVVVRPAPVVRFGFGYVRAWHHR